MTPEQLEILLQEGEGTMLEYKEDLSSSFARELAALANTLGGRILLGVRDDVRKQGCPETTFETNGFFTAIFQPNPHVRAGKSDLAHDAGQVAPEVLKLLKAISGEMTRTEIQSALELKGRAKFEERYLKPALSQGFVEMTIPAKPKSRLQKYRITAIGQKMLEE